jgi:integrase
VSAGSSLNHLERVTNPDKLAKLTTTTLSRFQSSLRDGGMGDTTIARHLRHIRAALSWGVSMGMMAKVPDMHGPRRVKGQTLMRGRAITAEEFDRLIAAVPKVRPHDATAWVRLLRGLWLSGLRLGEALTLSWDQEAAFQADLTGRQPSFRIFAEAQKSGRDEVLPMTPDFSQFLTETPAADRVGKVFKLTRERGGDSIGVGKVGAMVAKIGKVAGVVVNKADGKFASAHDLRRAFGTRWAKRVMSAVLKRLMRHSSIATTMGYYVDLDAAEVADQLWANYGNTPAAGNTLGNTDQKNAKMDATELDVTTYARRD